jgi:alpha-amylase
MRLDAAKHYSATFQKLFINKLREQQGEKLFFVGEYWKGEVDVLLDYLEKTEHQLSLFDVPLVEQFSRVSLTEGADMRRIFEGSLVEQRPEHAVVSPRSDLALTYLICWKDFCCKSRYGRITTMRSRIG